MELSSLETLANVASALAPINPPQYMTDIALGPEKELAKAALALSRLILFYQAFFFLLDDLVLKVCEISTAATMQLLLMLLLFKLR